MFERFTERGRGVIVHAQEEARLLNHSFVGTEHILLGLLRTGDGVAARALQVSSISLDAARAEVAEVVGSSGEPTTGSQPFTPRAKKVMEAGLREALQLGHNYIGTEHMLLGLLREEEGVGARVLVNLGADLSRIRHDVIAQLESGTGPVARRRAGGGAVSGGLVEKTDLPVAAALLLGSEDATALLPSPLVAQTDRSVEDGVVYETCTYHARPPPEVSVAVAAAVATPEAFDDYTSRYLPDAEHINGLGDAATYSAAKESLRVLAGSTVFVIKVRRHPHPRDASIEAGPARTPEPASVAAIAAEMGIAAVASAAIRARRERRTRHDFRAR